MSGDGPVVPVSRELVDYYRTDPDEVAAREAVDAIIRAEIEAASTVADAISVEPPTVDTWLTGEHRGYVTRMLRKIAEELCITELLFPRPIGERIAERAAERRGGRSIWRYRGDHRRGAYTVADLVRYVEAEAEDWRRYHRRSLRRPIEPMVFLGSRMVPFTFYVPPGGDPAMMTGTLTLLPDDEDRITFPALVRGEPGLASGPCFDCAEGTCEQPAGHTAAAAIDAALNGLPVPQVERITLHTGDPGPNGDQHRAGSYSFAEHHAAFDVQAVPVEVPVGSPMYVQPDGSLKPQPVGDGIGGLAGFALPDGLVHAPGFGIIRADDASVVSLDGYVPRVADDQLRDDVGQVVGVDLGIVEVGQADERENP